MKLMFLYFKEQGECQENHSSLQAPELSLLLFLQRNKQNLPTFWELPPLFPPSPNSPHQFTWFFFPLPWSFCLDVPQCKTLYRKGIYSLWECIGPQPLQHHQTLLQYGPITLNHALGLHNPCLISVVVLRLTSWALQGTRIEDLWFPHTQHLQKHIFPARSHHWCCCHTGLQLYMLCPDLLVFGVWGTASSPSFVVDIVHGSLALLF